jgi:hypothetical protein
MPEGNDGRDLRGRDQQHALDDVRQRRGVDGAQRSHKRPLLLLLLRLQRTRRRACAGDAIKALLRRY